MAFQWTSSFCATKSSYSKANFLQNSSFICYKRPRGLATVPTKLRSLPDTTSRNLQCAHRQDEFNDDFETSNERNKGESSQRGIVSGLAFSNMTDEDKVYLDEATSHADYRKRIAEIARRIESDRQKNKSPIARQSSDQYMASLSRTSSVSRSIQNAEPHSASPENAIAHKSRYPQQHYEPEAEWSVSNDDSSVTDAPRRNSPFETDIAEDPIEPSEVEMEIRALEEKLTELRSYSESDKRSPTAHVATNPSYGKSVDNSIEQEKDGFEKQKSERMYSPREDHEPQESTDYQFQPEMFNDIRQRLAEHVSPSGKTSNDEFNIRESEEGASQGYIQSSNRDDLFPDELRSEGKAEHQPKESPVVSERVKEYEEKPNRGPLFSAEVDNQLGDDPAHLALIETRMEVDRYISEARSVLDKHEQIMRTILERYHPDL